jgi:hypothetical protein
LFHLVYSSCKHAKAGGARVPSNELVLLNNLLCDWNERAPEGLAEDKLFDLFCLEQMLKDQDLSTEEIQSGLVGGADDGGIDGWLSILNGEVLDDDSDFQSVRPNPSLDLYLIQAKRSESFQEVALDRVMSSVRDLLDLGEGEDDLRKLYSEALVNRAVIFRTALMALTPRHPQTRVVFGFATKGSTASMHPKVVRKGRNLSTAFRNLLPNSSSEVRYLGARELLEIARRQPTYTLTLRFVESAISKEDSYIVLVNLNDFYDFITDNGALQKHIFEANVRDFQGDVEVNKDIERTLDEQHGTEFWWLNNGITILVSKASITGKVLALDDVQIVNGLQTSVRVFEHLSGKPNASEERALLCRVIVTQDPTTRDKIIKATNFQTAVSAASLRATDPIQRDIEEFFLVHRWYYDRRKNYYRNLGRPAGRIIRVSYLAQAVMAMGLGEPDNSRARPTTLIKRDEDYGRVFNESVPLEVYLWCAETMRAVDKFLESGGAPGSDSERREFRFHLAMWLVVRELGKRPSSPTELKPFVGQTFSPQVMASRMRHLLRLLRAYDDYKVRPLDRIAKNRDFVEYTLARGVDSGRRVRVPEVERLKRGPRRPEEG